MPVINITEQENVSFTAFDATENVVLIPMLYARSYEADSEGSVVYLEDENLPGRKYTSYKTFDEDMGQHFITVDNEADKSYVMAYELLLQGLSVVIKPITFDNASYDIASGTERILTLDEAYAIMEEKIIGGALTEFEDKNIFNIKFITSGGYANWGKLHNDDNSTSLGSGRILISLAETRKDAIALVEYRPMFSTKEELLDELNNDGATASLYAAAFFPWCVCNVASQRDPIEMPASYCYLSAFANSVQSNANWFAAAGVNRGRVPGLIEPLFEVGESLMHVLQGDNDDVGGETLTNILVNPVYNAGTYGYRIWGNRVYTKEFGNIYRKFLNVRILLCDIKKQVYHAAMRLTFEPNDDIVWVNFKTLASTPLERMKSGRGISWYKWTRAYTNEKGKIKATLTVKPIEAVESFDIDIYITDEDASIEEAAA